MAAAKFEELEELFDDSLELPVKGKTYKIPSPSGLDGLKIQRVTGVAIQALLGGTPAEAEGLDDEQEVDFLQLCLGPVYEELLEDGVDWAWIRHAGLTAMFWITAGVEDALAYWRSGGDPSHLAPNREARRRKKKSGSAAAGKTQRRGSTSTTHARQGGGRSRKASRA